MIYSPVENSDGEITIVITRSTQCGDEFLFNYACPLCGDGRFDGIFNFICECGCDIDKYPIELSRRLIYNTVAGTFRRHKIGAKLTGKIYREQEGRCAYCAKELDYCYHVEHIRPLAVGGTNKESNLCISCPECNLLAGAKVFFNFTAKQRYIIDKKIGRLGARRAAHENRCCGGVQNAPGFNTNGPELI